MTSHVKMACEDLQGGNPTASPVPVVHNPQGTEVLPDVQSEPPVPSLFLLSLVLAVGTSQKSLAVFSLHPPFRYLL